jgi:beta-glucosidase
MRQHIICWPLIASVFLSACAGSQPTVAPVTTSTPILAPATPPATAVPAPSSKLAYQDASLSPEVRAADLLARMTLAEKIGQMTQVEKNSIKKEDIIAKAIGSLLSGGGGSPQPNTAEAWLAMVNEFQGYALRTRLGIPLIYGVDAVHGHNNVRGATIFPHNVGLGATRDADLVERIGRATAEEAAATGIHWDFAPGVMVPQDIRWGRTYEGFSENTELVTTLATAYLRGLQRPLAAGSGGAAWILGAPKHYVGDGGTAWGSSQTGDYLLDQGVTRVDEATLRRVHLPPYAAAVETGAMSIMVSFSSWNETKMHAQKYLLTDVLKGELGFQGFLVSDWQAVDQISTDYYQAVVTSVNAGLDMIMVPYDYGRFIATLTAAVTKRDVPEARIDDAVRRILTVKFKLGLFEHPQADASQLASVGSAEHRALAREAVRKSLVLLKNDGQALPLAKDLSLVFVAGAAADDIGTQCGGWTIEWQGATGNITPGTSILDGIKAAVSSTTTVYYDPAGRFDVQGSDGKPAIADVGIAVVGEKPYAEGVGDREELMLSDADVSTINRLRVQSKRLAVVLVSGRPLVVADQLRAADAFVAAWLPGTEGAGVADVLFGDYPFTGKLPYTWPRSMDQLPFDFATLPQEGCAAPLFPFGYGLDARTSAPLNLPDCR